MQPSQNAPSSDNTLFGKVTGFFSSSSATPVIEPVKTDNTKQKIPRDRKDYKDNVTASLALPKAPKKVIPGQSGEEGYLSYMYNSVSSLVFKQNTAPAAGPAAASVNAVKISQQIKEIEKIRQQLTDDKKEENDKLLLQEIQLLEHQIKEHAARRVDLFFYLLLAVYNTHVTIDKDSTTKQHGRGSKENGTHACHCSLFPGIKLTPPPAGWTSFFSSAPPVLTGTYFEEALNMTVELPSIVNAFDGHLEGRYEPTRYVENCLDILNSASKGEIDPIQAMNRFFRAMNSFFLRYEKNHIKKGKSDTRLTDVKVWEYEKEGTFQGANAETMTINDDYLYLMLRLTPNEIRAAKWLPVVSGRVLSRNYKLIQKELLTPINAAVPQSAAPAANQQKKL